MTEFTQILHAIDPGPFRPMPIYIDQSTRWWIGDDLWHTESFKDGGPDRSRLTEVALSPGFGTSHAQTRPDSFHLSTDITSSCGFAGIADRKLSPDDIVELGA
jgi:hypothetical protein